MAHTIKHRAKQEHERTGKKFPTTPKRKIKSGQTDFSKPTIKVSMPAEDVKTRVQIMKEKLRKRKKY